MISLFIIGMISLTSSNVLNSDLVTAREIEDNIGADVDIVPTLMDDIPMRDYSDSNKFWTELVNILRSKMFDRDL